MKIIDAFDFVEAQALWDDPDLIEISVKVSDESRFLVIGKILGKHWSGIITYRTENVRIIWFFLKKVGIFSDLKARNVDVFLV